MNYQRQELRNKLAAEYVLGTLKGGARRRFERLLVDDGGLRALVESWSERLVPVGLPAQDLGPSTQLWAGIEERLDRAAMKGEHEASQRPLWRRWPTGAAWGRSWAAATGLALGVVGTLVIAPELRVADLASRSGPEKSVVQPAIHTEGRLPDSYIAVLPDGAGTPAVMASALRSGKVLSVKLLRGLSIDPEMVPVIWALSRSGAPALLGPLPTEGAAEFELKAASEEVLASIAELAVSIEIRSGRPFDAPQAGFVMRGALIKTW